MDVITQDILLYYKYSVSYFVPEVSLKKGIKGMIIRSSHQKDMLIKSEGY